MEELQLSWTRRGCGASFVDLAELGDVLFDRMGWIGAEVANH